MTSAAATEFAGRAALVTGAGTGSARRSSSGSSREAPASRAVALETTGQNVRVCAVAPGYVDTPRIRAAGDEVARPTIGSAGQRELDGPLATDETVGEERPNAPVDLRRVRGGVPDVVEVDGPVAHA
jgi:NAD(P)-dependent dehydrogenase (short-subunit alcohol dehydrogenase family)